MKEKTNYPMNNNNKNNKKKKIDLFLAFPRKAKNLLSDYAIIFKTFRNKICQVFSSLKTILS